MMTRAITAIASMRVISQRTTAMGSMMWVSTSGVSDVELTCFTRRSYQVGDLERLAERQAEGSRWMGECVLLLQQLDSK